jgi:hypothetical protein
VARLCNSPDEPPQTKFAEVDQHFAGKLHGYAEKMEQLKNEQADDLRFMIPIGKTAAQAIKVRKPEDFDHQRKFNKTTELFLFRRIITKLSWQN